MTDRSTAIWLYGSHARGDADPHSDRDVLIVGGDRRIEFARMFGAGASVSQYEWSEIEGMAEYGSLFLHHLRLEGQCLLEEEATSGRLEQLLESLGPYTRSRRDLRAFRVSLNDVKNTSRHLTTPTFELSVLATVLRHASVLGCYLIGSPLFGRTTAFRRVCQEWHVEPVFVEDFTELYRFRLHEEGRGKRPYEATWERVERWSSFGERFLMYLEGEIDAYERRLPAAD